MVVLLVEILENFLARNADQLALQTERPGVIHTSQFQAGTTLAVVQKPGAAVRARIEKSLYGAGLRTRQDHRHARDFDAHEGPGLWKILRNRCRDRQSPIGRAPCGARVCMSV